MFPHETLKGFSSGIKPRIIRALDLTGFSSPPKVGFSTIYFLAELKICIFLLWLNAPYNILRMPCAIVPVSYISEEWWKNEHSVYLDYLFIYLFSYPTDKTTWSCYAQQYYRY